MKASKISKDQTIKIAKTAAYLAASTVIGYFISVLTEQPEIFGVYTPIVNIVLVTVKQVFTEK